MIEPFSVLFRRTTDIFRVYWRPILIAALLPGIAGILGAISMVRMQAADDVSVQLFGIFSGVLLVSFILTWWFYTFVLVLSLHGVQKPVPAGIAVQQSLQKLVGMAGIVFMMFIRSFAWIPIIGFIIGFILLPRFALAPAIYLREGKGINACITESKIRTEIFWGKIVGNMLLLGLLLWIVQMILSAVLGAVGGVPVGFAFFVQGGLQLDALLQPAFFVPAFLLGIVQTVISALYPIFLVVLYEAIGRYWLGRQQSEVVAA